MSIAELREQVFLITMILVHLIIINLCPLTKPLGNIILNPLLNHDTTFDVLEAGIGRIWPGEEMVALFCGVHIWMIFC
jgi:hypothetical protein